MTSKRLVRGGTALPHRRVVRAIGALALGIGAAMTPTLPASAVTTTPGGGGADRFVTSMANSRTASKTSGPEFSFSTADLGRLGALGLVGVGGGWFVIATGRRRRDDETESDAQTLPLYLDQRRRRERRKLRNRLFHRDPSVDRRTQQRRQRRR